MHHGQWPQHLLVALLLVKDTVVAEIEAQWRWCQLLVAVHQQDQNSSPLVGHLNRMTAAAALCHALAVLPNAMTPTFDITM